MSRVKHFIVNQGEGFELKHGETQYLTCCDCGLVHRIKSSPVRGGILLRFWRDTKMTNRERTSPTIGENT
jgi:hypothetical protein